MINNTNINLMFLKNISDSYSISNILYYLTMALVDINTSLFRIASTSINDLYPLNQDVFSYIKNNLNPLKKCYLILIKAYQLEIDNNVKLTRAYIFLLFGICTITSCFIVFIVSYFYTQVFILKISYISIFFDINSNFIVNSLEKCENYQTKMMLTNKNEMEDNNNNNNKKNNNNNNNDNDNNINILDNDDDYEDSYLNIQNQNQNINNINNINNNNIKNINNIYTIKETRIDQKRLNESKKEIIHFRIFFIIFMLIILSYNTIVMFLFYSDISNIRIFSKYYYRQTNVEEKVYSIYNDVREYIFDSNTLVNYTTPRKALEIDLNIVNGYRHENEEYIKKYKKIMPCNYNNRYNNLHMKSVCTWMRKNEYFINENECLNYANKVPQFGFGIMKTYFVLVAREIKNYCGIFIEQNLTTNNLTLTKTKNWYNSWPINENELDYYVSMDPISFFNRKESLILNVCFRNILYPIFNKDDILVKNVINDWFKQTKLKYILMIVAYLVIVSMLFIFYWIPFVYGLNQVIYKTKNMLSIIPKEVLASLENIKKVLDIGNNNDNQDNNNNINSNNNNSIDNYSHNFNDDNSHENEHIDKMNKDNKEEDAINEPAEQFLNNYISRNSIRNLRYFNYYMIIIVLIGVSLDFYFSYNNIGLISKFIKYGYRSYTILRGIVYSKYFVTEAVLAQEDTYSITNGTTNENYIYDMMNEISIYRQSLSDYFNYFIKIILFLIFRILILGIIIKKNIIIIILYVFY